MKWLLKLLLIIIPIVLIINIYRYYFRAEDYQYQYYGMRSLWEYLTTYDGLGNTIQTINNIKENLATIGTLDDFWLEAVNFFKMIGNFFMILVAVIQDLINNIIWLFGLVGIS